MAQQRENKMKTDISSKATKAGRIKIHLVGFIWVGRE